MSKSILVGYEAEVAEEARVPLFHMILTGITQHGKTEELKRVVTEAQRLGYTILILDVKDKPEGEKGDFEDFGVEVPIYLAGIADTLAIYGLLESHSGLPLRRELPELARACKRGKTLRGAFEILKELLSREKIHPVRKDRIEILVLVLEGLVAEMDKAKPSSKLRLKKGEINVMTLRGWSSGFKQLAVNDATAYIRKHYRKTIEVFDEAHQQIPQGYGSGSKRTVTSAIKEGAGSQQYVWVADQTIKEVDKDVIAQIPIKIYGGQPGAKLRAKETLDHLPVKSWRGNKITAEFIMQLETGFFLLGERNQTRLVYALPVWMPAPLGRLVAQGKCSPATAKEICDLTAERWVDRPVLGVRPTESPELRERYETLKSTFKELEGKVKELESKVTEVSAERDKQAATFLEASGEHQKNIVDLKDNLAKARAMVQELTDKLKHFEYFEEALRGILEPYMVKLFKVAREAAPAKPGIPSEISVTTEQPALSVKVERKALNVTDEDLLGKLTILYAEGDLGEGWFTTGTIYNLFKSRAWTKNPQTSAKLDSMVRWGFLQKRMAGRRPEYRVKMKPEEAKAKGLLKVEE